MNVVDAWAEMSEGMVLTTELKATFKAAALKDAHKSLAKLEAAASDEEQYYALPRGAFAAFNLGQFDDAKRCAEQALTLADNFKDNWNFGNAVHRANSVRGLLARQNDDRARALAALHASGATPGSPQLNSFGPTMQLAIALLEVGERDAVLRYLDQCGAFWRMGTASIAIWRRKIVAGQMPNFFSHRYG